MSSVGGGFFQNYRHVATSTGGVCCRGLLKWEEQGERWEEIMMPACGLVGPTDIRLSSQSACASGCAVMWFSPLLVFAPFSMLSFVVLELPGGNMNPNERGCGNGLPHNSLRDEQARYGPWSSRQRFRRLWRSLPIQKKPTLPFVANANVNAVPIT